MTASSAPSRILVLGSPRSGTTWTSEVLGTAPGALLVHEPDNEVNDAFALVAKIGLGRFPAVGVSTAPTRFIDLWREAFLHGSAAATTRSRLAAQLIRRTPRELRDEVLADSASVRARLLRRALEATAAPRSGGTTAEIAIVKSVHAAFCAELIEALVEPRVVVIRRHPLNVLSSWIEFGWEPQGLDTKPELVRLAGLADVEPFAPTSDNQRRAMSYVVLHARFDRLLAEHPTWVSTDHDDLCIDPLSKFRLLFDELGLAWTSTTEAMIDESNAPGSGYDTKRVASEQRNKWRKRLDPSVVDDVVRVLDHYGIETGAKTEQ